MAIPVKFDEADGEAVSRSNTGAMPLPRKSYPTSSASCWQLSPDEIQEIQRTGRIWIRTDTFTKEDLPQKGGLQPTIRVSAFKNEVINDHWIR